VAQRRISIEDGWKFHRNGVINAEMVEKAAMNMYGYMPFIVSINDILRDKNARLTNPEEVCIFEGKAFVNEVKA